MSKGPVLLTPRRLMIRAVAVAVALVVVTVMFCALARTYYRAGRAEHHRRMEEYCDAMASTHAAYDPANPGSEVRAQLFSSNYHAHSVQYRRLREKWERGARWPWISVAPDPPQP